MASYMQPARVACQGMPGAPNIVVYPNRIGTHFVCSNVGSIAVVTLGAHVTVQ